ncbi:hypothetical protein [Kitasatospora sp. NPDC092286]|uniref:hypothetical protein n=1 Tax=Kitasatospora sp. NPDC092286 TaxID=3364087 RepID=UPI003819E0D3
MPASVPDRPGRFPSGTETVLVVVIVLVAAALVLGGLPMYGALEFIGAVTYLACRTVKGLRGPNSTATDAG